MNHFNQYKEHMLTTEGHLVAAYCFCKRKALYAASGFSGHQENVHMVQGAIIDQQSFPRLKKRQIQIGRSKIDLIEKNTIVEIKKSSRHLQCDQLQLAFYMALVSLVFEKQFDGECRYPTEKKRVQLLYENLPIDQVIETVLAIDSLKRGEHSQFPVLDTHACRACAYQELCLS